MLHSGTEKIQLNDTLEERVAILEFQVAGLEGDVTSIIVDVTDQEEDLDLVEGEIAVISAEQVLQDERILELEVDSDGMRFIAYLCKENTLKLSHISLFIIKLIKE